MRARNARSLDFARDDRWEEGERVNLRPCRNERAKGGATLLTSKSRFLRFAARSRRNDKIIGLSLGYTINSTFVNRLNYVEFP
jgi:hypothetical protein